MKVKKIIRKKFKNCIFQICYLDTNFSGHLESKYECCLELPSCASVFTTSASFV